jgi:hypothetical protein
MFAIFSVALSVVLGGAFLLGLGKMIPVATEPPRAKAVGHAQKKGETAAFRHAQVPELLKTPEAGVKTLYDVAQASVALTLCRLQEANLCHHVLPTRQIYADHFFRRSLLSSGA